MPEEEDWLRNSDVYSFFPTLVWKIQLPTKIVTSQNPIIINALKKINPHLANLKQSASWQSHHALHEEAELDQLLSCIGSAAYKVLRFLKIGAADIEVTGCWANVNGVRASHLKHNHPNNFLSGVYYVQAPPSANTINFHDPRPQASIIRPPVTELTGQNTDQVVVGVTDGTLLIFPSYVQHSVGPNESDKLRISISFNLMFSQFTEELSKPLWEAQQLGA